MYMCIYSNIMCVQIWCIMIHGTWHKFLTLANIHKFLKLCITVATSFLVNFLFMDKPVNKESKFPGLVKCFWCSHLVFTFGIVTLNIKLSSL